MAMQKIKKNILIVFILVPFFYLYSMFLLSSYTLGDQVHYWNFYEALTNAKAKDVMFLAVGHVGSVEPISSYLLWLGAILDIEKNDFISLLNIILLLGLTLLLRKYKVPFYIYFFMFSNFYIIVLMTGAERLKIAYIFLVYGALVPGKLGLLLALASPLAHLQSFIFLAGLAASKASDSMRSIFGRMRLNKRDLVSLVVFVPITGLIYLFLQEGVMNKSTVYMEGAGGISELFQMVLLVGVSSFVVKDRVRMGLMLITMMVAVFLLGSIRINMIAFTLFVYLMILEGRLQHPLVLALLAYFSLKSVFFVRNIFIYGNGFGGWLL